MVHSLELYSRNSSSSDSSTAAVAASHWGSDASAVTAFYTSTSSSSSSSSSVLQYLHAWAMAWPEPGGWWLAWWLFQQVTDNIWQSPHAACQQCTVIVTGVYGAMLRIVIVDFVVCSWTHSVFMYTVFLYKEHQKLSAV
jgi:hypothetical protein